MRISVADRVDKNLSFIYDLSNPSDARRFLFEQQIDVSDFHGKPAVLESVPDEVVVLISQQVASRYGAAKRQRN